MLEYFDLLISWLQTQNAGHHVGWQWPAENWRGKANRGTVLPFVWDMAYPWAWNLKIHAKLQNWPSIKQNSWALGVFSRIHFWGIASLSTRGFSTHTCLVLPTFRDFCPNLHQGLLIRHRLFKTQNSTLTVTFCYALSPRNVAYCYGVIRIIEICRFSSKWCMWMISFCHEGWDLWNIMSADSSAMPRVYLARNRWHICWQ